jgi:hypothetical protein
MSVDLVATLCRPVSLNAVVETARETLSTLLGGSAVPAFEVAADSEYRQGATVIGGPIVSGVVGFEIAVPATGDGVRLMVVDHGDERRAVFSPDRTCVGVAVATGLALAAARLGHGEFLDYEIFMLTPPVHDPGQVVSRTRLVDGGGDFGARCERYLRQFPDLNGWPPR